MNPPTTDETIDDLKDLRMLLTHKFPLEVPVVTRAIELLRELKETRL